MGKMVSYTFVFDNLVLDSKRHRNGDILHFLVAKRTNEGVSIPRRAVASVRGYCYHFINSMPGTAFGAITHTTL